MPWGTHRFVAVILQYLIIDEFIEWYTNSWIKEKHVLSFVHSTPYKQALSRFKVSTIYLVINWAWFGLVPDQSDSLYLIYMLWITTWKLHYFYFFFAIRSVICFVFLVLSTPSVECNLVSLMLIEGQNTRDLMQRNVLESRQRSANERPLKVLIGSPKRSVDLNRSKSILQRNFQELLVPLSLQSKKRLGLGLRNLVHRTCVPLD